MSNRCGSVCSRVDSIFDNCATLRLLSFLLVRLVLQSSLNLRLFSMGILETVAVSSFSC